MMRWNIERSGAAIVTVLCLVGEYYISSEAADTRIRLDLLILEFGKIRKQNERERIVRIDPKQCINKIPPRQM